MSDFKISDKPSSLRTHTGMTKARTTKKRKLSAFKNCLEDSDQKLSIQSMRPSKMLKANHGLSPISRK